MGRTDRACRVVRADPAAVYAALIDPDLLTRWLPPTGMTGRFEWFDARPGGSYRLILTYPAGSSTAGKSSPGTDIVQARFVELDPGRRIVQAVDFASDDPAFAGTMTMVWELTAQDAGTRTQITAHDVPPGISPLDHVIGMAASLDNLARLVET